MSLVQQISIILVEPQLSLNVGSALRASWNMGIRDIRLVEPCAWEPERIAITAPGLSEAAQGIPRYASLQQAIADGILAVGFTARPRRGVHKVWDLRQFALELPELIGGREGRCHLLFGREDFGLSNEALGLCHGYVVIPTDHRYSSLNLAQAVLLACYAIRSVSVEMEVRKPSKRDFPPARLEDLDGLMDQIQRTLRFIEFFKSPGADVSLLRTVRRILSRAALDQREVLIFRGIFAEVVAFCRRMGISRDP
ncbi:MAG: hypothetical protein JW797_01075 [Bradymonadales bacterium]|nr:hypothetical protein [Bradymonadales bacterium]